MLPAIPTGPISTVELSAASIDLLIMRLGASGFDSRSELITALRNIRVEFLEHSVDNGWFSYPTNDCRLYGWTADKVKDPDAITATLGDSASCLALKKDITIAITEYMDDVTKMAELGMDPSLNEAHAEFLAEPWQRSTYPPFTSSFLAFHDIDPDTVSPEFILAKRLESFELNHAKDIANGLPYRNQRGPDPPDFVETVPYNFVGAVQDAKINDKMYGQIYNATTPEYYAENSFELETKLKSHRNFANLEREIREEQSQEYSELINKIRHLISTQRMIRPWMRIITPGSP